ncbi:MAG: autotransporter domain-containing protein [Candidatus Berkiellales bacterium]
MTCNAGSTHKNIFEIASLAKTVLASSVFCMVPITLCAQPIANQSNTIGVAGALNSIAGQHIPLSGTLSFIVNQLPVFTDESTFNQELAALAPTVSGSVTLGSFRHQLLVTRSITDHLNHAYTARGNAVAPQSGYAAGDITGTTYGTWVEVIGQHAHQKNRNDILGYDDETWGIVGGGDLIVTDQALFGLAFSWLNAEYDENIFTSSWSNVDAYQTTLYGQYDFESPWYFNWLAAVAYNRYSMQRNVTFGSVFTQPSPHFHGWQYAADGEFGYDYAQGAFHTIPLISLFYSHLDLSRYTERGSDSANQTVNEQSYNMLLGSLGLKFAYDCPYQTVMFQPEVHLRAYYDFYADTMATTSVFIGAPFGPTFNTTGFKPPRDSYNVGASITTFGINTGLVFIASYDFDFQEDFTSNAGFLRLRYEW